MSREKSLVWLLAVVLLLSSCGAQEPGEASFTFDAEKWRSGLGAIYYGDCTAKRGAEGQWTYEPGRFAIA